MTTPSRSPSATDPVSPAPARFVHLKVHSAYSLLEGALPIPKLAKLAAAYGFPALGLTDTNNLFGALEFSDKLADAGIQPIIGVALNVDFEERQPDPMERRRGRRPRKAGDGPIALLAMSEAGYANLMKLVSRAHLEAADVQAVHTTLAALEAHADGLIALTGGPDGPIDRALREGQHDLAEARLKHLEAAFGDRLYVEIQRHGLKSEHDVEPQLLQLAYAHELPHRRHQRGLFRQPRRLRGPRRASMHRGRALRRGGQPAPRDARALSQERRGDGASSSPTFPRRSPPPSRSPSAAPSAPRAASRSCRASSPATMQ